MLCENCGSEMHKKEVCNYCKKNICFDCVKSSRKVSKTMRVVICGRCWSDIDKRSAFKSATKES